MLTEHLGNGTHADKNPAPLPDGERHGTLRAIRRGCACEKCNGKRARMRRHGFYVR